MIIEVINTGTELLLGTTLNTHGAWLGQELMATGLRVSRQSTVPDGAAIGEVLAEALERSDAVIVTGGLGPTSDDLTREMTAEVMGLELIEDEAALRSLEAFFALRSRSMPASNRKQALHPCGADVLPNLHGTAPGVYVPPRLGASSPCAVFLLPGPPNELRPMFQNEVMPRLLALSGLGEENEPREMRVCHFIGVGESELQDTLDARLDQMSGLEVGYCAHLGQVDLRLMGTKTVVKSALEIVRLNYSTQCYTDSGESLENVVVARLRERGQSVCFAESCTGGGVAARLTDVAGASMIFEESYVTYSNEAKMKLLGVPEELLAAHGAVSEEVAISMAVGAQERSGVDYALSVTGIAGPAGGTDQKPVGTVWIALAARGKEPIALKKFHPRGRAVFREVVTLEVLDLLRRQLI